MFKSYKTMRRELKALKSESEVTQSCPTLCDPMDCSLPGSSVHGIFQARILEWAAISFSKGSSQPRDQTQVSCIVGRCFYHLSHQGSPREGSPGKAYCPWWSQREASRAVSQFDCPVGDLRDISSRPTQALLYLKNAKTLLSLKTTQKQLDWI